MQCPMAKECKQHMLFEEIRMLVDNSLEIEHCYPMAICRFLENNKDEFQDCPNLTCGNIIRFEDDIGNCELCNEEVEFGRQPLRARYMGQNYENRSQPDDDDMNEVDFNKSVVVSYVELEQN